MDYTETMTGNYIHTETVIGNCTHTETMTENCIHPVKKLPDEKMDDLQIKGYKILQKTDGFCFGMDAVLLSDYARVKKGAKVMDLCSGTGIIPILLEAKYPLSYVEGLEYQERFAEMAERSVTMNGQENVIHMVQGDVKEVRQNYAQDSFNHVTCNPPYMTGSHGLTNDDFGKAIARHEILCSLEDVVSASAWLLKQGGHLTMVHRPFRLAEIICMLRKYKLEPKRMRLVYPYVDKEPNMVLIDAVKGGKQRITVDPPLIVYQKDGSYTEEIYKIYGMNNPDKEKVMAGTLYLCATPIGNLEDITFRVLRTLKEVDLIAAEDTRNSIKLLNHFEIKTKMTSYHEYNKVDKAIYLVEKLKEGMNIALITDAGTPGISDPGEELVRQCYEAGVTVTSLPGPCACITALTMSGQATRRFAFEAFLPFEKKERAAILKSLENETRTIIIYEAPHRLKRTLKELCECLGEGRQLTICKELTKRHEKKMQGTFAEMVDFYEENEPRGEYVLVIAGKTEEEIREEEQKTWESMSIEEHMAIYEKQNIDRKTAMKMVAKDRGISKRDVYQALLES